MIEKQKPFFVRVWDHLLESSSVTALDVSVTTSLTLERNMLALLEKASPLGWKPATQKATDSPVTYARVGTRGWIKSMSSPGVAKPVIEEIQPADGNDEPQGTRMLPSMSALSSAYQNAWSALLEMKDVFSPSKLQVDLPTPSADHPGIENVKLEEALEKCPHLKKVFEERLKNQKNACPQGHDKSSEGGKCPVGMGNNKQSSPPANSRCPYQNPESHEWPMRAVLIFIAFNFVAAGFNVEFFKVCFVCAAWYLGMLKAAEFVVLYVTTASMSSYKLLGLLLMLTNKGGPKWSWDLYNINLKSIFTGVAVGFLSIAFGSVVKHGEIAGGIYREKPWTGPSRSPYFSPLFHIVVPILNEFVYRHFMLTELGKDLGTWFGLLGSSVWFGILAKASSAKLVARVLHGAFLGSASLMFKNNLLIPTIAHAVYLAFFAVFPSFEWLIVI